MPLDVPTQGEFGAALGAARLAICGVTKQSPEQVMTKPAIQTTLFPRADLVEAYDQSYIRFAASFPTLKALQ